ncbi:uncharacterized protein LOC129597313 isoform X2 [Paramacrobiotus metropolitanus]|uniref:uncharacterized protein LOC129597313 isoform X2 n=1 Tax=Paramacrobiotus metropolitanus TaxID=2943436 RepID=UPI002446122F|nr:uncharacterized protein LOC129597313 isoform X2 [Paramacrobiotus metropolitanus]
MAGKYLYATNFEQKFSNGFTVYQIKLEERATTTQENGFLQLSHNDDFENGEFDNFEENIEVGCTYELLAKPAKRTDSKTEMEQLRLSILPLITAFTTDMDGTSINVQRYYGIDYTVPKAGIPRICYILAENCEGLPLDCYMYALQGKNENSGTVFGYIEQILKGLEFLHRNCIIHRDIRGANVIVLKDKRLVKIAGLTMIKHFHGDKTPSRTLGIATGTVPFVSPEMAALTSLPQQKKQHVGRTTDIWSFGCVIIQMIQKGRPPSFTRGIRDVPLPLLPSEVTLKDMNKYFEMGYKPVYPSAHKCDHRVCGNQSPARCLLLTEGILILLENCLIPLPDLRPSAAKLLELLETFSRAKKGLNNEPENAGDPQANILASHHCDPFADCELPKKFTNSADTIKNPGDTITQLVEHELPVTENVQLAVKMLRLEDDVESTSQGVERSTKAEATHQFLSHDEAELGATYSEPDKTLSFSEFKPFPFFDQSFRIEIQRFLIARFILRPDSITATDDKDKLNLPDLIKSSLGHEDNAVKEKIVIPGGFRGGNALSGVSVILLRDNDSWDGPLFQNKRDVFDKLIKHSGEKSEIIKHLAIARTVQKFWIFTESEGSPARYQVSKDEFRLAVIVNGFPQPTDSQYESFAKGVPYGHFTSRRELGMFLANILHESAGLRYRKEISPQPEYGKYYGRGYMQLTWEDNYRKASQALYHDDRLVENPDQVADDEDVAWATACWYWGAVVHSYPGVAEGKFGASIRAINSEEEGMGRNEVKSRARNEYYKRILAVFVPGEAPVESGS